MKKPPKCLDRKGHNWHANGKLSRTCHHCGCRFQIKSCEFVPFVGSDTCTALLGELVQLPRHGVVVATGAEETLVEVSIWRTARDRRAGESLGSWNLHTWELWHVYGHANKLGLKWEFEAQKKAA